MRRRIVALALGLATLAACTSPTEPTHSATGVWKGTLGASTLSLTLTMHADRSVTGQGTDSLADLVARFPVRGTVSGSTVVLLFTPTSVDSGFSGRFTDGARIEGSVEVPGRSTTIAFHRQ